MTKRILLSILCLTYNQKDYIEQCIDSFLMQKTNFDFEILINDDASNDGTVEILKKYQHDFPDKVILNLQSENQYTKGVRNMIPRYLLPKARGKYLAVCEGDDFWTDPQKLQKQVDFLEKNHEYSMCFHPVKVFFENKEEGDSIYPNEKPNLSIEGLLDHNFIQTNSVVYRKQNYNDMALNVMPADLYLHLYHSQFGKIGYINTVMASYRRHPGGIWWDSRNNADEIWKKHGVGHLALFIELLKIYGNNEKYRKILESSLVDMFNKIIEIDNKYDTNLLEKVIDEYKDKVIYFYKLQNKKLEEIQAIVAKNENDIKYLNEVSKYKDQLLSQKDEQYMNKIEHLNNVLSSKRWKVANSITRILGGKKR